MRSRTTLILSALFAVLIPSLIFLWYSWYRFALYAVIDKSRAIECTTTPLSRLPLPSEWKAIVLGEFVVYLPSINGDREDYSQSSSTVVSSFVVAIDSHRISFICSQDSSRREIIDDAISNGSSRDVQTLIQLRKCVIDAVNNDIPWLLSDSDYAWYKYVYTKFPMRKCNRFEFSFEDELHRSIHWEDGRAVVEVEPFMVEQTLTINISSDFDAIDPNLVRTITSNIELRK